MLYYEEVFASIQGESKDSGIPTIFIRLFGCPVGCSYCDQKQKKEDKKRTSVSTLINKVRKIKGINHICITGGEPLIHEECLPLVYELLTYGYKVSIETSGCVPIEKDGYSRSFRYVMDIKCPSSGVSHKNMYDNLFLLNQNDEVKFVIRDRRDYNFMKDVLKKYPCSAEILVSPMFLPDNTIPSTCKGLSEWVLEDRLNVRMQIQLHKILGVK